jgi:stress response protein YsnF
MTDQFGAGSVETSRLPSTSDQAERPVLAEEGEQILPLHSEEVAVSRRKVEGTVVRIATVTHTREAVVNEQLTHERVEIERVPVGRVIETVPSVREEGDTTIIPVVEEIIVVERRLVLKEEVHLRKVRVTEQHRETVVLREQDAVITRTPPNGCSSS